MSGAHPSRPAGRGEWGSGRSLPINVRVSEDEKATIYGHAAERGLTASEYVRRVALDPALPQLGKEAADALTALAHQLRMVGNNLNQVARTVHLAGLGVGVSAGLAQRVEDVLLDVSRCEREIRGVLSPSSEPRGQSAKK